MKKIISVLLSAVLIMSLSAVGFTSYAEAENKMKIAVASDLHYNNPRAEIDGDIDDDIYWYANRRAAMEDESGFIIDEFLNQCAKSDCEYVLISGDMADHGKTDISEHEAVAAKFAKFEQETGKQVFVIDGNHDVGIDCATEIDDFKRVYADFGYKQALVKDPSSCSYTADLGDNYRLIALDSCDLSKSTEDGMTMEKVDWVLEQAKQAQDEGKYIILMMHHNLLDHMPLQRVINRNFIVRFHYTTADLFANNGIHIVLTGHEHCSDATKYISTAGNAIYDFATTSLTMYPLQYRTFTLSDHFIRYAVKTVDKIDFNALTSTVSGYSDEQISLMKKGLNDYSKGFLKAGVQYRLEQSLTMEKMGIAEDAIYYDLIDSAVGKLVELLQMPLYGEDSVEETAAKYGIEIPESGYKTGWDLATDLVAMHYAGEEAFDLNSTEVTILLRTASLILREVPATVDESMIGLAVTFFLDFSGINQGNTRLNDAAFHAYTEITDNEYFAVALLAPFLYEFAYDDDLVNDNTGELAGFKDMEGVGNNALNMVRKLINTINTLCKYILAIFNFLKYI